MAHQSNSIIAVAFTTLDGVVEDPDGSWGRPGGGWALRHGPQAFAGDKFHLGDIMTTGSLLFGRHTWELFAQRWPARTGEFADAMNAARKAVATRTLDRAHAWSGSTVLQGDLAEGVERLRSTGDVVVIGSTGIVHELAAHELIDEYRLLVFPTVAGTGRRLFAEGGTADLRLVGVDQAEPCVLLRYRVEREQMGG